jgi:hypothetical protein
MPDRVIRASILGSEKVSKLSWPAEVFYRRIMSIVDDFGRYEADSSLLRAYLYPKKLDKVSEPDVVKWMSECSEAGLVRVYTISGKPYLQIEDFDQRLRAMKSKFPAPPSSADRCQQLHADDGSRQHPLTSAVETKRNETETETNIGAPAAPPAREDRVGSKVKKFIPPTAEEAIRYFLQLIGNPKREGHWPEDKCHNQASLFFDHYETNGWVQNKGKPVKNWEAAARNWVRREIKGDFRQPDRPQKNQPAAGPSARKEDPEPRLSQIECDLNAMYLVWREDNEMVTVISATADHYDFLKKRNMIMFTEEEIGSIRIKAQAYMKEKSLEGEHYEKRLMKSFGVLEFFRQWADEGADAIFEI